jgi:hypothetical protein
MSNNLKDQVQVNSSANSKLQLDARQKQKNWLKVCQGLAVKVLELKSVSAVDCDVLELAEKELRSACNRFGAVIKFLK